MSSVIQKKKIGEVVEVFNNRRIPLSAHERKSLAKIYPYYGAQNIVDFVDDYLFDGEYILVAEDGENLRSKNQNICNLVDGKFWVNNHAHILKANSENNTKYLYYNFNKINFEPFITGSAQPKLNKENLLNIVTSVHHLEDQQKIASVLSALDSKIELNNLINAELEAMAKTLYDYWFVQFDFPISAAQAASMGKPNLVGKPYKSSGGKMVWNQEMKREIPEGWEVKGLFNVCNVQYGFPFSTNYFNSKGDGVPVIRIRDIIENSVSNYSTEENIGDKYLINQGDILIGMDGNFHINYWSKSGCYLNQRVVKLSETVLPNIYLKYQVEPYIKLREESVSRTTVGHLSDKDLKGIKVILPHKDLLNQTSLLYNGFLKKIVLNKNENQQLASLRDWLLPMLMNGQVTVGGAYAQTEDATEHLMAAEPIVTYGRKSKKN